MKSAAILTIILFTTCSAWADFSYTTTRKTTGGSMAGLANAAGSNPTTKYYFKGQKMRADTGTGFSVLDFDAQTITTVDNARKTVSVRKFSDLDSTLNKSEVSAKIDAKETGQKKTVNGFTANELMMTIDVDSPATAQMGKMQMEIDMWLSAEVPGADELHTFYQKNAARFPWRALGNGGSNQNMEAAMSDLQRKVAEMNGVPVLEVVKVKMPGGAAMPAMPQLTPEQQAQMQAAMQRMQQVQGQGGPQAAAMAQAMARMGAARGAAAGGGSGSLMEMTMESSDFSTSSIPESVFAIPAGYQKVDPK